jgi:hypothetical protein
MVIGENPEKQLQPYHEYECTGIEDEFVVFVPEDQKEIQEEYENHKNKYSDVDEFAKDWYGYTKNENGVYGRMTNPNSKWDWYQLGGRWTGYLKLKVDSTTQGVAGEQGIMTPRAKVGYCDQTLKKNIDIESMVNHEVETSSKQYDIASSVINGESFESWDIVRERFYDTDKARSFYHNQKVIKRWSDSKLISDNMGFFTKPSEFSMSKKDYLKQAADSALTTFAVVKDSVWHEKGEMGWFACVSHKKEQSEWNNEFMEMFNSLPEDTLISIYDCHI